MTIASATNRVTFAGDAATTSFATTPIKFFDTSDLLVYATVDATGVATLLVEGTGYTVSGGSASAGAVGTVDTSGGSTPYGAPATGVTLSIIRELPLLQGADFVQNDASNADVAEAALDKLVLNLQRVDERLDRAVILGDGDVTGADLTLATPAASKLIGWDATGLALTGYASASVVATVVPTAYMEALLAEADADAVVQNIITGGTAESAPAVADIIAFSDVSLTPDDGRTCTLQQLFNAHNGLTEDTAPDYSADFVPSYDTGATAAKKIKLQNLLPAGIGPLPFSGSTIPNGWLECDGSAVSRTTYARLFAAVSTTWGVGDGSTTFNLPFAAGRSPVGAGTGTVTESPTASSANGFTVTSNNDKWHTGMTVVLSALTGFTTSATAGPTYYAVRVSATNVRLATTLALAQSQAPDITLSGTGTATLTHTYTARTLGEYGGKESHAQMTTEVSPHIHSSGASGSIGGSGNDGGLNLLNTTNTGAMVSGGSVAMPVMNPFLVTKMIISY